LHQQHPGNVEIFGAEQNDETLAERHLGADQVLRTPQELDQRGIK
jgi:hypothetical protein